jgi:hypothetical protein
MSVSIRESFMPSDLHERKWPVLLAVWATFLLFGAIAAPVPGVNEPHYLCKSKHFWQPEWCHRDFFLVSPNAHSVFYATIGSLTQCGSFEQAAWAGRIVTSLMLALGWIHGLSPLFFTRWATLWTACLFLGFAACGNFSGEWLVGGVEGKVPCYSFLLAALGETLRGQKLRAAALAGLAVSVHPVVGLWGVLAFAMSQGINWYRDSRQLKRRIILTAVPRQDTSEHGDSLNLSPLKIRRGFLTQFFWPFLVFVSLALPGLIPVFRLLTESVSPETRYTATYLQVYYRLAHHLDPMLFPLRSYVCYALIFVVWLCSFGWGGRTNSKKRFDQIVVWSVVFAVSGVIIGWGPRPPSLMPFYAERMQLLKFYPFRLADVLLPIALAVSLVSVLERSWYSPVHVPHPGAAFSRPGWLMAFLLIAAMWRAHATTETNRYSLGDRADWLNVCSWTEISLRMRLFNLPRMDGHSSGLPAEPNTFLSRIVRRMLPELWNGTADSISCTNGSNKSMTTNSILPKN